MALEMRVYEELTQLDPKVMAGMTVRQLSAAALIVVVIAAVSVPMWLAGYRNEISYAVIPFVAPIAAWGWIKPMGLRFEVWVRHVLAFHRQPKRRLYGNWAIWAVNQTAAYTGKRERDANEAIEEAGR